MIDKPKGRNYYTVKFHFKGRVISKRTRARSAKDAKAIESTLRSELARGNWGILTPKPSAPPLTLAKFLKDHFLKHVAATAARPATARYYHDGVKSLLKTPWANIVLSEITGEHAGKYAAQHTDWTAATINCGLRTLRRALNLAENWGHLTRAPKIVLAKGEHQRERVLTDDEIARYLPRCRQPLQDIATVMLGTGLRPGEVCALRWENIVLADGGGLLRVVDGKSKAARRTLPIVPAVLAIVQRRNFEQGQPDAGWVFPARSNTGHANEGSYKKQHAAALKACKDGGDDGYVAPFPPYTLRHTALTQMGALTGDPFTLARIAGHSSIAMTQRYIHPAAEAVQMAFERFGKRAVQPPRKKVVTKAGYHGDNAAAEKRVALA